MTLPMKAGEVLVKKVRVDSVSRYRVFLLFEEALHREIVAKHAHAAHRCARLRGDPFEIATRLRDHREEVERQGRLEGRRLLVAENRIDEEIRGDFSHGFS